jgi:hypothetical protein
MGASEEELIHIAVKSLGFDELALFALFTYHNTIRT